MHSVRISSRESLVLQKFQNEGLSQALKWDGIRRLVRTRAALNIQSSGCAKFADSDLRTRSWLPAYSGCRIRMLAGVTAGRAAARRAATSSVLCILQPAGHCSVL